MIESKSVSDSCTENEPDVQFHPNFNDTSQETHHRTESSKSYFNEYLASVRESSNLKKSSRLSMSYSCNRCTSF